MPKEHLFPQVVHTLFAPFLLDTVTLGALVNDWNIL